MDGRRCCCRTGLCSNSKDDGGPRIYVTKAKLGELLLWTAVLDWDLQGLALQDARRWSLGYGVPEGKIIGKLTGMLLNVDDQME